ncbi:hypothetical protein [Streptomyces sp. NPDC093094]|uniref:hypothetical protein n=1 Tax=Streptomyces sp. NPDC093094 TaxID=3366026 RepID=UPI003809AA87
MAAVTVAQATATAEATATTDGAAPPPPVEGPARIRPQDARELSRPFPGRPAAPEEDTPERPRVRGTLAGTDLSPARCAALAAGLAAPLAAGETERFLHGTSRAVPARPGPQEARAEPAEVTGAPRSRRGASPPQVSRPVSRVAGRPRARRPEPGAG